MTAPRYSIALVGRPNVGKSTLFNRLAGKRLAIVHDRPGVTRDWRDTECRLAGVPVRLIDTAGLEESFDQSLEARMRSQTEAAVRSADLVLFIVDAQAGVTPLDQHFADWLRKTHGNVLLLANKAEARGAQSGVMDAFALGMGEPFGVSAEHGMGMGELELALARRAEAAGALLEEDEGLPLTDIDLSDDDGDDEDADGASDSGGGAPKPVVRFLVDPERPIQIAIVGRPNAGKSTLINALLGEKRMLTGPEAGITRDAIAVDFHRTLADGSQWQFRAFDTAGLRRKAKIVDRVEYLSAGDSLRAIRFAQVVILLVDAIGGFDKQDLTIARHVIEEGRGLILALNKWDAVESHNLTLQAVRDRLQTSLPQVRGIPVITISAEFERNLDRLMQAVVSLFTTWSARISTPVLNRWLSAVVSENPPPMVAGRRIKPRFLTQAKTRPPSFALFGNKVKALPDSYQRYLTNRLRQDFKLDGPPLRLYLREGANPYGDRK